jgi:hypothetical protein
MLLNFPNNKSPKVDTLRLCLCCVGSDLLSHVQGRSTISASRLNFSVRNGKRWIPAAITTNNSFDLPFNGHRIVCSYKSFLTENRKSRILTTKRIRFYRLSDLHKLFNSKIKKKKAVGQLVSLGYIHHCTSTYDLSTQSSSATLQPYGMEYSS